MSTKQDRDALRKLAWFCATQELKLRQAAVDAPILSGIADAYAKASSDINDLLRFDRQSRHQTFEGTTND